MNNPIKQINEKWGNAGIYIRGNDETGYAAVAGAYRITEIYKTVEEVETELKYPTVDTVVYTISAIIDNAKNIDKYDVRSNKH